MITVAVDAMGGDNAPSEIVAGAVAAAAKKSEIKILLVGKEDAVKEELKKHTYNPAQIEVIHASEVIATEEAPVNAIRREKDSSIVVGMNLVKQKQADAFVSAGSSRGNLSWRSGNSREDKRSRKTSISAADSNRKWSFPADRLWSKRGCKNHLIWCSSQGLVLSIWKM